jgi:hypothetical protein
MINKHSEDKQKDMEALEKIQNLNYEKIREIEKEEE